MKKYLKGIAIAAAGIFAAGTIAQASPKGIEAHLSNSNQEDEQIPPSPPSYPIHPWPLGMAKALGVIIDKRPVPDRTPPSLTWPSPQRLLDYVRQLPQREMPAAQPVHMPSPPLPAAPLAPIVLPKPFVPPAKHIRPPPLPRPPARALRKPVKPQASRWGFSQEGRKHPAWYSLKNPRLELRKSGREYLLRVTPPTTYRGSDLRYFKFGVNIGDKWYNNLKPNVTYTIILTEKQYKALLASKKVDQVIFYKEQGNRKIIHASLNNERYRSSSLENLMNGQPLIFMGQSPQDGVIVYKQDIFPSGFTTQNISSQNGGLEERTVSVQAATPYLNGQEPYLPNIAQNNGQRHLPNSTQADVQVKAPAMQQSNPVANGKTLQNKQEMEAILKRDYAGIAARYFA